MHILEGIRLPAPDSFVNHRRLASIQSINQQALTRCDLLVPSISASPYSSLELLPFAFNSTLASNLPVPPSRRNSYHNFMTSIYQLSPRSACLPERRLSTQALDSSMNRESTTPPFASFSTPLRRTLTCGSPASGCHHSIAPDTIQRQPVDIVIPRWRCRCLTMWPYIPVLIALRGNGIPSALARFSTPSTAKHIQT